MHIKLNQKKKHQSNSDFAEPKFTAIVLAGGLSSRMGTDKALLSVRGNTLLSRTINLAYEAGAQEVLVSRNKAGFIQDVYKNHGPLSGLHATLPICNFSYALVLAVDMPILSCHSLRQLVQFKPLTTSKESNKDFTGQHFVGHPLPAFLMVNNALKQELTSRLTQESAPKSLNNLWRSLNFIEIPSEYPEELLNTNDPQTWQEFIKDLEP